MAAAERQRWEGPASAAAYLVASLVMTTSNKYAASVWRFPSSSLLLLAECAATAGMLRAASEYGRYKPWSAQILRHLPALTAAKAVNMYLSFMAMQRTSIPVYNVLKRLNPVFSLLVDRVVRGAQANSGEQLGVLLICVGTLSTGVGDLEFDLVGYVVATVAAVGQSLYIVLSRHASDKVTGLGHVDLLFYTSFFNLMIFGPLATLDVDAVLRFCEAPGELRRVLCLSPPYIVMGAILNFTTFWCTTVNSPLATGVSGSFKGVLSTAIGVAFFGAQLTVLGWVGLVLSALGGFVYSAAQVPPAGNLTAGTGAGKAKAA
mmetsp:Transcript_22189/g.69271  ORF Transcript_22189/g.69271 Transcript_22189/m.69271 type:complete len:318 (-) Transcript_22189:49-1002(-)